MPQRALSCQKAARGGETRAGARLCPSNFPRDTRDRLLLARDRLLLMCNLRRLRLKARIGGCRNITYCRVEFASRDRRIEDIHRRSRRYLHFNEVSELAH